jgi:hypothetical protein
MNNQLTEHGLNDVEIALQDAKEDVAKHEHKLRMAKDHLIYMEHVDSCKHDLRCLGGIERVQTRCNKCGFSWFD